MEEIFTVELALAVLLFKIFDRINKIKNDRLDLFCRFKKWERWIFYEAEFTFGRRFFYWKEEEEW